MSKSLLFAFLRFYDQLKVIKWRLKASFFGRRHYDPVDVRRSMHEIAEVNKAIEQVFQPSQSKLWEQIGRTIELDDPISGTYNCTDLSDVFLFGIISEIVQRSPPLPVQPSDRTDLHLLRHFMRRYETTLEEARAKIRRLPTLYNDETQIFKWVVEMGRQAYRTSDTALLIDCQRRCFLWSIPSSEFEDEKALEK